MNKLENGSTYTIILVPHSGQGVKQLHIRTLWLKALGVFAAGVLLLSAVLLYQYNSTVRQSLAEKEELRYLREINGVQGGQIQQLAQTTVALQEDLQRIKKLDSEVRKMVGVDGRDTVPVSRGAVMRPVVYNPNGGQGGPGRGPDVQQLLRGVEQLKLEMNAREASLLKLRDAIAAKQAQQARTPSTWPANGEITSPYGYRTSPWGWGSDFHPGVDIADSWGTPIYATAAGTVIFSSWDGGYGQMVVIDHGNGIQTAYAHNAANLVSVGQSVTKGAHIADMGSTGASTGPHVHYEVRVDGQRVNPLEYM